MELEIREMKIDDLAPVFHLGEQLFTSQEHSNLYRTWDEFEVTSMFQSEPDLCLVADLDGEIAGFAMGRTIEKSGSAWSYGHLVWIGVDTSKHRRGIGDNIFEEFRNRMLDKNIRIIVVDTQADNVSALNFFKKHGFTNATDHVYLSLNLDPYAKRNSNSQ